MTRWIKLKNQDTSREKKPKKRTDSKEDFSVEHDDSDNKTSRMIGEEGVEDNSIGRLCSCEATHIWYFMCSSTGTLCISSASGTIFWLTIISKRYRILQDHTGPSEFRNFRVFQQNKSNKESKLGFFSLSFFSSFPFCCSYGFLRLL